MTMTPRQVIDKWVECFNSHDNETMISLYHEDAEHERIAVGTIKGRDLFRQMANQSEAQKKMHTIPESIYEVGNKVILEWKDNNGMRGCVFFTIEDGLIVFQRSYWDKLTFMKFNPQIKFD